MYPTLLPASFSLNEPDSQRITIVMTIIGLNRRNQQKDQVKNGYRRQ